MPAFFERRNAAPMDGVRLYSVLCTVPAAQNNFSLDDATSHAVFSAAVRLM